MTLADPFHLGTPTVEGLVELDVHREQRRRGHVAPVLEQSLDRRPRRERLRPRRDAAPPGPTFDQHREGLASGLHDRRVSRVAERDDADPRCRVPAHVRPVARIAATVGDVTTDPEVVRDGQAVAIATSLELRARLRARPAQRGLDRPPGLLHLAPARPAEGMALVRVVPWRERVEEARHPARQVADRGEDPAHRREGSVRIDRLRQPGVVAPHVAQRQSLLGDVGSLEGGRGHARAGRAAAGGRSRAYSTPEAAVTTRPRIP